MELVPTFLLNPSIAGRGFDMDSPLYVLLAFKPTSRSLPSRRSCAITSIAKTRSAFETRRGAFCGRWTHLARYPGRSPKRAWTRDPT